MTGEGPRIAQELCGCRVKVRLGNSGASWEGLLLRWKVVEVMAIRAGHVGRGCCGIFDFGREMREVEARSMADELTQLCCQIGRAHV